ncbi:hypothetical protein M218_00430 [Burkholderia pseudomallei MSHR338]|uniref:hypothetical protein n=1 Tax=Burkholderia pseudomallei TaxID=28450 RepID=UPI0001A484DF|nr:hypothetical protein [Burkholderia pseudomallei]ACQ97841.1 conserved hypothetical protein [Burkholderia pseudomallei MSHR346]AIP10829.1 hypothetical protein DP55_1942 [Burkholderia pseudomallei]EQA90955.1 hypothetical protein M218_00430 [Burkholderia pseudomallei MSHR338]KGD36556.1 hypothetical protein DO72_2118 [Burkholderia pseudomallei]KGV10640.1 hypothetical protein X891_2096 [Burkholderia pseudomallei TSV 43]
MSQYVRTAVIEGFDNAPPLDTNAPIELQFAVDLGAVCADAWLELKGEVRLHDYAAFQVDAFVRGLNASMHDNGDIDTHHVTVSGHAFVAGLMGRVQQHLFAALGVTRYPRTTH